ncbi:MAG TPA: hypothetical protein VFI61_02075 [Patescibacteria group bacterium]|nr:hypothetical protein [Patescibacteria group bacterium]
MVKNKFLIVGLLLSFFLLTTPALAENDRSETSFKRGLTEPRLKSCQSREDAVKTRMNSLIRLVTNMESKFDSIAQRVKDFYTNTLVPSGKIVPNYDALVANIQAKKDVITTDLNKAQTDINAFSCTADDPKSLLTSFRTDMQKVKLDLKDYRTSIKNLIVAVRRLTPTPKPEETEEPEATPTATP